MEEKLESTKRTAAFRELMGSVEAWWAEQMNDCGCRPLQRLQAIIYAANNVTAFNLLSGEDFDGVLRLLQMSDAEELGKEFPDETLFKFRNANKHPLKGLMKFGDDEVEVDFKGLPDDHMIPEVIEAQRRFVVYRIVSRALAHQSCTWNHDPYQKLPGKLLIQPLYRFQRQHRFSSARNRLHHSPSMISKPPFQTFFLPLIQFLFHKYIPRYNRRSVNDNLILSYFLYFQHKLLK